MNSFVPYLVLFFLVAISLGWLCFSDKIRNWMNSVVS